MPVQNARARRAVAAIFFVNGALTGVWAANIPGVKERLGLDPQILGFGFLAMAGGALAGMPPEGWPSCAPAPSSASPASPPRCSRRARFWPSPASPSWALASPISPVIYGAAGRLKGVASGVSIASVVTMDYAGFLVGPPVIGFVAQGATLQIGLSCIGVACLLVALMSDAADT